MQPCGAVIDEVGRMIKEAIDPWKKRLGVAESLLALSGHLAESCVMLFIKVIVPKGLDDRNEQCREIMRKAAVETVKNVSFKMLVS